MVLLAPVPAIAPGFMVQLPAGRPFKTTLPVGTVQVGCVTVPIVGASGVDGCALMTTLTEAADAQPTVFVTVKLYVPATKPDMVVTGVEPDIAPGFIIQFPAGNPLKATLPVATEQVGCVIVPTIKADGIAGCALITTLADAKDIHPAELVTVKVCIPANRPDIVALLPLPAIAPGFITQLPEGKPLSTTLPVADIQVGCVIAPTAGADGVAG